MKTRIEPIYLRSILNIPSQLMALVVAVSLCVGVVSAQTESAVPTIEGTLEEQLPAQLVPWVKFVKARHPEWDCPKSFGPENQAGRVCIWPGKVSYLIEADGVGFVLQVVTLKSELLVLPSGNQQFPTEVKVFSGENTQQLDVPLVTKDGLTYAKLPPGNFRIEGKVKWGDSEREIPIPDIYGIVEVKDSQGNSHSVSRVASIGTLVEQSGLSSAESLSLAVFRRIEDGSPVKVSNMLRIRVSGGSRTIQLGQVIPKNSLPVSISTSLPYQLTPSGELALQLSPGEHSVVIDSVMPQPVTAISLPQSKIPEWPEVEVLSWKELPQLRTVEIQGAQSIHASATELPENWRDGATYNLAPGEELKLEEKSRGEQSPPQNSLSLEKELWIDLSGQGFTARDVISGSIYQGFRLNALSENKISRAQVAGQPTLITADPSSGVSGVELRSVSTKLETVSHLSGDREISAVGWDAVVDSLDIKLNLPPSWTLLHVSGATHAYNSWFSKWRLLDVFTGMLVVVAAYRLLSALPAVIIAAALFINHGEHLAPRNLLVHVLLLIVICRLLAGSQKKFRLVSQAVLGITYLAWALQALAFAKLQFTQMLFPQLQAGTRYRTIIQEILWAMESNLLIWPVVMLMFGYAVYALMSIVRASNWGSRIVKAVGFGIVFFVGGGMLVSIIAAYSFTFGGGANYAAPTSAMLPPAPAAMKSRNVAQSLEDGISEVSSSVYQSAEKLDVSNSFKGVEARNSKAMQSGAAIPVWQWRSHYISVPAPVDPSYRIKFYLMPPSISQALCGLRALLMVLIVVILARHLGYSPSLLKASKAGLVLFCLLIPRLSFAEFPSEQLLGELEQRLTKEVCVEPQCSSIQELRLSISNNKLTGAIKISSDGPSSVILPGPLDVLPIDQVTSGGKSLFALRRDEQGFLRVKVNHGQQNLTFESSLGEVSQFSLQLPQSPMLVSFESKEWRAEGILRSGFAPEGLKFSKISESDEKLVAIAQKEALPNWVVVERVIYIGDSVTEDLILRKVGQLAAAVQVRVPLREDERILSGPGMVEGQVLVANIASGQELAVFRASLPKSDKLELKASASDLNSLRMSEDWTVSCDSNYQCQSEGLLPATSFVEGEAKKRWYPFPGESVTISVRELQAVAGDFITVDTVTHSLTWGTSYLEGELTLSLRATAQSPVLLELPEGEELTSVELDSNAQPILQKSSSSLVLNPGDHSVVAKYRRPFQPRFKEFGPAVKLSLGASNINTLVTPSPERWILWVGGGQWGPCVVFWSKLFFVSLIVFLLSKFGLIPVGRFSSVMLGVGLTTLPLVVLPIPLAWLALLELAPRFADKIPLLRHGVKIGIIIAATVIASMALYYIVHVGLVLSPPMLIAGNGSSAQLLRWYSDYSSGEFLRPYVISVPIWWWRAFSLVWATWLVLVYLGWLKLVVELCRGNSEATPD